MSWTDSSAAEDAPTDRLSSRAGVLPGTSLPYAEFLIHEKGYFEELKGPALNSHAPLLGSHRRMLAIYKQHEQEYPYSVELMKQIIAAGSHPDNA